MSGLIPRWDRSFIAGPISESSVPGPESDPEKVAEQTFVEVEERKEEMYGWWEDLGMDG